MNNKANNQKNAIANNSANEPAQSLTKSAKTPLIKTERLFVRFPLKKESPFQKRRYIDAVSDVSIELYKGETFALVGESGCGKSTLADATLGFIAPSSGEVFYKGERLDSSDKKQLKAQRMSMQKVFQDPTSSLNPRFTVARAAAEPLIIRRELDEAQLYKKTLEAITSVGLFESDLERRVTEFSGGQQQRIAIARALAAGAEYLVCDEPVSALDVSVHAQILNLLMDVQKQREMTCLFISHNLASVRKFADRMAIMYLGRIVEYGEAEKVFARPAHPYTRALIDSVLSIDGKKSEAEHPLQAVETAFRPNEGNACGCAFFGRCPIRRAECGLNEPPLELLENEHYCACLCAGLR